MLDQPVPHATSATRAGVLLQPRVHVGDRGQPVGAQEVHEHRAVHRADALSHIRPVGRVRHARTRPVGVQELLEGSDHADHLAYERDHPVEAVVLEENLDMAVWDRVPAVGRRDQGVFDGEDAGHRLLLEPLPHVPLVGCGPGGHLSGGRRADIGERAVESEPVTQVHRADVLEVQRGAEQPLDQGISRVRVRVGYACHDGLLGMLQGGLSSGR